MNKALWMSAAIALALSGSVLAKGSSYRSDTDSNARFTESDCAMLTVDSARSSCMRSINANAGTSSDMGTGATTGTGEGMTSGTGKTKKMHHSKHRMSRDATPAAETQHQTDKANGNQ